LIIDQPMFPRHQDIDLSQFDADVPSPIARYGLPQKVQFCHRCVISNQRPGAASSEFSLSADSAKQAIHFDGHGICDACRVWEDKHNNIDWDERERELRDLCDRHRRTDGRYDCIVPGSGGKDSFVQAHVLKYKYDMHPLTITWTPQIYTDWGWRNFQSWIHAGFDNHLITPSGRTNRLLTRLATESMLHPFQPFVFGQKTLPARFSIDHDIPLIFHGDHAAEYGTPKKGAEDSTIKVEHYVAPSKLNDLLIGGVTYQQLLTDFDLNANDLSIYIPPNLDEAQSKNIEFHHLAYFLKWHPQANYYYAVEHGGFEPSRERIPGTYQKYSGIDDKVDDFNFYCYFIKFGIGRATHDAASEIRARDIDREEGVSLVRRYDGEFPNRFMDDFFQYISLPEKEFPIASAAFEQPVMDRAYFDNLCDRFRSPHIWKRQNDAWTLRNTVYADQGQG